MRVLHMPVNTASRLSITVRALRQLGIDAQGLAFATTHVHSFDDVQTVWTGNKRQSHHVLLSLLRFGYHLARYLRGGRPDVIHWYYSVSASTLNADLAFLRALRAPGIIEWMGTDIRIPEVEFAENPYYAAAYNQGYEYHRFESLAQSRQRQQRFTNLGLASGLSTGMEQYVQRDIIPQYYSVQQRLLLSDFAPIYPNPAKRVPLVVHSPTALVTKGTAAVLRAVEGLKPYFSFEFRLIQGTPRAEALRLVQSADIFLDQFVLGDRGLASLEAMAFGKAVVCYIKPSLVNRYPPEMPIVNTTQHNLAEVLAGLLTDGQQRYDLGRCGRAYVEKYHDALAIAGQLINIYQEIISRWPKTKETV